MERGQKEEKERFYEQLCKQGAQVWGCGEICGRPVSGHGREETPAPATNSNSGRKGG